MKNSDELNEMINDVAKLAKLDDDKILIASENENNEGNEGIRAITGLGPTSTIAGEEGVNFKYFRFQKRTGLADYNALDILDYLYKILSGIYDMETDQDGSYVEEMDSIINIIQGPSRSHSYNQFFSNAEKLIKYMDRYENIGSLTKPTRSAAAKCMRMMVSLVLIVLLAYKHGNMTVVHLMMEKYISDHEYGEKMAKINSNLIKEESELCVNNVKEIDDEMDGLLNH